MGFTELLVCQTSYRVRVTRPMGLVPCCKHFSAMMAFRLGLRNIRFFPQCRYTGLCNKHWLGVPNCSLWRGLVVQNFAALGPTVTGACTTICHARVRYSEVYLYSYFNTDVMISCVVLTRNSCFLDVVLLSTNLHVLDTV